MAAMIAKAQWLLVHKIRDWGWNRTLGLALAAAAGLVYFAAQHNLAAPLSDLQEQLAAAQKTQALPAPQEPEIAALQDLPTAAQALGDLKGLQNLASERGLSQESGQYKLEQDAGLVRYRLNMPLTGSYPAVRMFLSQALASYPNLAVDNLRISREQIGMSEVDAALQLSLYFKP